MCQLGSIIGWETSLLMPYVLLERGKAYQPKSRVVPDLSSWTACERFDRMSQITSIHEEPNHVSRVGFESLAHRYLPRLNIGSRLILTNLGVRV